MRWVPDPNRIRENERNIKTKNTITVNAYLKKDIILNSSELTHYVLLQFNYNKTSNQA